MESQTWKLCSQELPSPTHSKLWHCCCSRDTSDTAHHWVPEAAATRATVTATCRHRMQLLFFFFTSMDSAPSLFLHTTFWLKVCHGCIRLVEPRWNTHFELCSNMGKWAIGILSFYTEKWALPLKVGDAKKVRKRVRLVRLVYPTKSGLNKGLFSYMVRSPELSGS